VFVSEVAAESETNYSHKIEQNRYSAECGWSPLLDKDIDYAIGGILHKFDGSNH